MGREKNGKSVCFGICQKTGGLFVSVPVLWQRHKVWVLAEGGGDTFGAVCVRRDKEMRRYKRKKI